MHLSLNLSDETLLGPFLRSETTIQRNSCANSRLPTIAFPGFAINWLSYSCSRLAGPIGTFVDNDYLQNSLPLRQRFNTGVETIKRSNVSTILLKLISVCGVVMVMNV